MRRVDLSRAEDLLQRVEEPFWKAVFHGRSSHHASHPRGATPHGRGVDARFRVPPAVAVILWVVAGMGLLIWLLVYSLYSNTPTFPGAGQ